MVALCNRADHYIFACDFFLSSFFPRLISAAIDWMSTILRHVAWPYCKFIMHVWNVPRALAGNAGPKKSPKSRHMGTIAQFCRAISSQPRHLSTIGKTLLSSDMFCTCLHNMVNVGLLAAEIGSLAPWRNFATCKITLCPSMHHRTSFSGYVFAIKARIDNRKKTCSAAICPPDVVTIWWTSAY